MPEPIDATSAQARLWLQTPGFSLDASQFSFSVPGAGAIWAGYAAGSEPFKAEYAAPNAALAAAFRGAIALWDDYILPDFLEVSEAAGSVGELRIAFTNVGDSFGYAYSGTPQSPGRQVGDVWVSPSTAAAGFALGDYGFMGVLHEVGHTLGLKHSFDEPGVPAALDNYRYTLMSYTRSDTTVRFEVSPNGGLRSISTSVNAATPMVLDILAAQAIYGAEASTRTGDNVYIFTPLQPFLQTIFDAGGNDRVDASNMNSKVVVDLRAGAYSSIGVQTLADQIAHWSALYPGSSSFIRSTLANTSNLFTYTDNVAIAFGVTIENATGGSAADSITGNEVGNVLNGNGGADTLIGLGGDDIYYVDQGGDVVVENAGDGTDMVYTNVDYALAASSSIELLSTTDTAGMAAINLTGSIASQTITGNNGANIINGGPGGPDTLVGLGGDDTYLVRSLGDRVVDNNGQGFDTIYTTTSYNLGESEIEVLSTVRQDEATTIDLIGNFTTQTIVGNYGNNVLNGGSGGLDTLIGLRGDDVYAVGDSRVDVIENAGEGNDTVVTSVNYGLDTRMSIEVLAVQNRAGTATINLFGNEQGQTIAGNNGVNYIDGGAGADVLIGGGGVDTFAFTTVLGGGNVDLISDFVEGTDRIGLLNSVFNVGANGVTASNFVAGSAALDGDDRVVYNASSGQLFYDADGNGAGAAIQFAVLTQGTPLTFASFDVLVPATTV